MSDSPKASRGDSPKIPRPTAASPKVRPPPVLPKSYNTGNQSQAETFNQSAHSYLKPTDKDRTPTYNQSMHSYLELLPDATPEELGAVQASQAKAARGQNPNYSKKPRSKEESLTDGSDVKQKAKAFEGKFKLSTNPTLGRQKLTDGKYTSVVDGDVYKQ